MEIKPINANVVDLLQLAGVSSLAVAGEAAVARSVAIPLPFGNPSFSLEYQAESGGTVALKLELEQGNEELAEEGTDDDNFVVPEAAAELDNDLADELVHIKSYAPAATAFARVKVTGLTDNDATTVITKLKLVYIK